MRLDDLLGVLRPDRFGVDRGRPQDLQVARVITSVEVKGFIEGEAWATGSDRQDVVSLLQRSSEPGVGGIFSIEETGSDLRHQRVE